jgi:hypothetical protein
MATPLRTATATPTITPSPTPTGPYTPAAVMRLEDAERTVLGWLDPERSPRIEAAYYVTEGQMHDAGPDENSAFNWRANWGDRSTPFPGLDSPRLLLVIMASTQGMDMRDVSGLEEGRPRELFNEDVEWPNWCNPVRESRRQSLVTVFDAATGEQITEVLIADPETAESLARLAALGRERLRGATPLATATTTETMTPVPASWHRQPTPPADLASLRPLEVGEVPAALVETVREVPLVKGAEWVYDHVTQGFGVYWTRDVVTRTIDAAWEIAPDAMLVRELHQSSAGDRPVHDPSWRYWFVYPEGITGDQGRATIAEARGTLAAPQATFPWGNQPKVSLEQPLPIPLRAPDLRGASFQVVREALLEVPAGAFRSCFVTTQSEGGGSGSTNWVCRGVGTALYEAQRCFGTSGGTENMELLRYRIPEIRPVGEDR